MKVVVTGCAGFIGSRIVERLLDLSADIEVVGVDAMTDYYDLELKRANLDRNQSERFTFYQEDLATCDLVALLADARWIFHQAGQPGVRSSWGVEFDLHIDRNIRATQRLLEVSRNLHSLEKFVYASSSSLYGDAQRYPTLESDVPKPKSPYGVTKLAAENLCSLYSSNFGVPCVSLRYFTVYGPNQRPDMLFHRLFASALGGDPVSIFGDGSQVRDFTFVDDIVEANLLAASAVLEPGTVMNVSGGSNVSVNEVLAIAQELTRENVQVTFQSAIPGDVMRTGGDSSLITRTTGWEAKISIADGLRQMWEHMSGHPQKSLKVS